MIAKLMDILLTGLCATPFVLTGIALWNRRKYKRGVWIGGVHYSDFWTDK